MKNAVVIERGVTVLELPYIEDEREASIFALNPAPPVPPPTFDVAVRYKAPLVLLPPQRKFPQEPVIFGNPASTRRLINYKEFTRFC